MTAAAKQKDNQVEIEAAPADVREFWRGFIEAECMRNAAALNLVADGELRLGQLPADTHEAVVRGCAEIVERACRGEMARGGRRTDRLRFDALEEIWRLVRPFARSGANYVGHIVGSREERADFLQRIGGLE